VRKTAARQQAARDYSNSDEGKAARRTWYTERGGKETSAAYQRSERGKAVRALKADETNAKRREANKKPEVKASKKEYNKKYSAAHKQETKDREAQIVKEKRHYDPVCDKAYPNRTALDRHLRKNVHGKMAISTKYYGCDTCDEAFRDEYGLEAHLESESHALAQAEIDILMDDVQPFPWEGCNAM